MPTNVNANQGLLARITRLGRQRLQESDIVVNNEQWINRIHQAVAMLLHFAILLSANHSMCVIHHCRTLAFGVFGLMSAFWTSVFFSSSKTYEIFDFENLFFNSGGEASLIDIRESHPERYFNKILKFFQERYPDAVFTFRTLNRGEI